MDIWQLSLYALTTSLPKEEILRRWKEFAGEPQRLNLPSAPKQFLTYFEEDNMPQTRLNRDQEHGMGVSIGRLREDSQYDYKFVCLSPQYHPGRSRRCGADGRAPG